MVQHYYLKMVLEIYIHILENIDRIDEFLDADALILDSWSSNFVNDLNKEEEVL